MRAFMFVACFSASLALFPYGLRAQDAPDPLALSRIEALALSQPEAALDQIGQLMRDAGAVPRADIRVLFDLQRQAADLLARLARWAEAGPAYAAAAQAAARYRDLLAEDPADLWRKSAEAEGRAGNHRAALAATEQMLQEQRDGGLSGAELAATLDQMAGLADRLGDATGSAAYRAQAAQARDATGVEAGLRGEGTGFSRVQVFYATDRARSGASDPDDFYGSGRAGLDYGIAEVTVPDTHVAGAIEKPSIWRLEFSASPTRHVMLRSVGPVDKAAFFAGLQARMAQGGRKEAFIFIHGYNVSFAAGAKRAAQLAFDMNFSGVPILYSWPSRAATTGYLSDSAVVQLSARRLSGFLDDVVARSGADTVHIVAHSMGNRALTEALELMALRRGNVDGRPPFDQVVFAAPDVDAGLFAEMLPTIRPLARRMTLYASENDWALVTSRHLHGDAPRAGQAGADTLAVPQIDSLDMSELGEDMLAHGYFASDRSALVDLAALFWQNADPSQRCGLEQVATAAGIATWRYIPGICPDTAILATIGQLQDLGVRTQGEAQAALGGIVPNAEMSRRVAPLVLKLLPP